MSIWNELGKVNVTNKEIYTALFSEIVRKVRQNQFDFEEKDNGDYKIVIEENRMRSIFVHIVPQEVYSLFKKMHETAPQSFLGFSVVAGRYGGKEVRVSCFGIPCNLLAKSLLRK